MAIFGGSSTLDAFFDESDGAGRLPITSVSGYVFEKERYLQFEAELRAACDELGIEFFRTSECLHKTGQFARFPKDGPTFEDAERRVIALVREYAFLGVGASVSEATFKLAAPPIELPPLLNAPYSMLCHWCLAEIGRWADDVGFGGSITYMFESGNDDQSRAGASLNWASKQPILRAHYRYESHGFVNKGKARGLEAADLLAYFIRRE